MTPLKHFSKNTKFTQRIRKGGLYVAVATMLAAHTQCGSGNGSDWEEVTTYEVTQGVITTLEEVTPGKFEIIDEQVVAHKDSSRVVVNRLNGSVDTLDLSQVQGMVAPEDTVSHDDRYYQERRGHGMGSVLWWGAMGYMMGRSFNSPTRYGVYRQGSNNLVYRNVSDQLKKTSVSRTQLRPVSGKSGYFRKSTRSSRGA